ncbi:double zinc ribbon domain-containing protein [Pseudoluteimonas lycopersici]
MPGAVNFTTMAMVDGWRRAWRRAWPAHCLACGGRGAAGRDLCAACHAGLPWLRTACPRCALPLPTPGSVCGECLHRPPPLDAIHAAFLYAPPLDRLLPRFKFHGDLAAGRLLAALMRETAPSFPHDAVIVPVPLHRKRLRMRGYDQALELAKPLAATCGLPLRDDLLHRARATAAQSRLHADQRKRNLRNAFEVDSDCALPACVVLVDDVMTTGATLHAAAKALRKAGVARVEAWVCARVP